MATLDTVATRPSGDSHATGKAYFETSTNQFIVWNGSSWIELVSDGTGAVQPTTSLSFDGNNDYLHTASFTLGATYSFSMWFNFDAQASISNNALLNSEHYYTDGYDNFVFRISNATTMHLYSYSGLSSAQAITITVPTLSTETWYNLVLTNSGSGSAQGYLNGNSVTTSGSTSRAFTDLQNTKGLIIGDNLTNNNKPFDGELDEVAVFNTALSASEVSSLAASRGAHIKDDLGLTPFAYYRMGEDDNLTDGQTGISQITDASGNGNHATQATAANQPTASVSLP